MLSSTIINNKEMMSYDDYVFDIITGTWISAMEYESFLKIDNDETDLEYVNKYYEQL
jgi:hypothetical protein